MPLSKVSAGRQAQLGLQLARINGIVPVVARAVFHKSDLGLVATAIGLGLQLV
jgi:hypothetical protein